MLAIYFGSPGCGKSTLATRLVKKANKKGLTTATNFGCSCADYDNVSLDGLGGWTFDKNTFVCIDESGIEYNNRSYKTFPKSAIKWYKKHRHYLGERASVALFSQSWEDTEITLRRLADRLYYVRKFGPFTLVQRVYKKCTVDKQTEQIIDGYKMINKAFLLLKPFYYASYLLFGLGYVVKAIFPQFADVYVFLRRPYYKYFNTHDVDDIPIRYPSINKKARSFPLSLFSKQAMRLVALLRGKSNRG